MTKQEMKDWAVQHLRGLADGIEKGEVEAVDMDLNHAKDLPSSLRVCYENIQAYGAVIRYD
jgi:hypothetical protein